MISVSRQNSEGVHLGGCARKSQRRFLAAQKWSGETLPSVADDDVESLICDLSKFVYNIKRECSQALCRQASVKATPLHPLTLNPAVHQQTSICQSLCARLNKFFVDLESAKSNLGQQNFYGSGAQIQLYHSASLPDGNRCATSENIRASTANMFPPRVSNNSLPGKSGPSSTQKDFIAPQRRSRQQNLRLLKLQQDFGRLAQSFDTLCLTYGLVSFCESTSQSSTVKDSSSQQREHQEVSKIISGLHDLSLHLDTNYFRTDVSVSNDLETWDRTNGSVNAAKLDSDMHRTQSYDGYSMLPRLLVGTKGNREIITAQKQPSCGNSVSHQASASDKLLGVDVQSCKDIQILETYTNDVEFEIRKEQMQELHQVNTSLASLHELQGQMAMHVKETGEHLDAIEGQTGASQRNCCQTNQQIAIASKRKAKWWTFQGSSAGMLTGGIVCIALGPIGVVAGAAVGGAMGMAGGAALRRRHNRNMDAVIQDNRSPEVPAIRPSADLS